MSSRACLNIFCISYDKFSEKCRFVSVLIGRGLKLLFKQKRDYRGSLDSSFCFVLCSSLAILVYFVPRDKLRVVQQPIPGRG